MSYFQLSRRCAVPLRSCASGPWEQSPKPGPALRGPERPSRADLLRGGSPCPSGQFGPVWVGGGLGVSVPYTQNRLFSAEEDKRWAHFLQGSEAGGSPGLGLEGGVSELL